MGVEQRVGALEETVVKLDGNVFGLSEDIDAIELTHLAAFSALVAFMRSLETGSANTQEIRTAATQFLVAVGRE